MARSLLLVALGLALASCWVSEKEFFGAGDWAHLDLDGSYISEDGNGHEQATVELVVRPDGLIEGTSTGIEGGETEHSVVGLVPVAGGSGRYFILVDRSDGDHDGALYLLGHLTDEGGIEMYWPQCSGTPDIDGMTRESPDIGLPPPPTQDKSMMACNFTSKDALQKAALEAERFLSAPHIVDILPIGRLRPQDGNEADQADPPGEAPGDEDDTPAAAES